MVLEWYLREGKQHDADGAGDGDDTDWTSILKDVRQHQGCLIAARSTSIVGSPAEEWTVIGKLLGRVFCPH